MLATAVACFFWGGSLREFFSFRRNHGEYPYVIPYRSHVVNFVLSTAAGFGGIKGSVVVVRTATASNTGLLVVARSLVCHVHCSVKDALPMLFWVYRTTTIGPDYYNYVNPKPPDYRR